MSHDPATTAILAQNTQLLALSEGVQAKLPRELRDMIYAYLFDADTLKAAHKKIFTPTLSGTLIEQPLPPFYWPDFLRPTSRITETMRRELVEYFIEHNTRLEVHSRACLEMLFARDLFDTGLRLSAAAIPAMAIHLGPLEYNDSDGVEAEWNRSASLLLHGGQKLAHDFKLEVHLRTSCGAPPTNISQIKDVILYIDMVYPAVRKIQAQVTAKVPGSTVVFKLDFRQMFRTELVVEVREEMLEWDANKWVNYLRAQV